MDILVLSDTHGRRHLIPAVLEQINFRPAAILFLGDGQRDLDVLTGDERFCDIPVVAVRGNCDSPFSYTPEDDLPTERTVFFGGRKIFLSHGDRYMIGYGVGALAARAAEKDADVAFFGHTHVRYEETFPAGSQFGMVTFKKPLLIANPGSLGKPRDGLGASFGVLTLRGDTVLFSHGTLGDAGEPEN